MSKPREFWINNIEDHHEFGMSYTHDYKEGHLHVIEKSVYDEQAKRIEELENDSNKWSMDVEYLEKKIETLEKVLAGFKIYGTDGCSNCEMGRIGMYYHENTKCFECNNKLDGAE